MIEYFIIATLISMASFIYYMKSDFEYVVEQDLPGYSLRMFISNISEGLIIGLSWIISIPILCIGNIIISLGDIIYEIYCKYRKGE